jgi:hypothetical protein
VQQRLILLASIPAIAFFLGCGAEFPDQPAADEHNVSLLREAFDAGGGSGGAAAVALAEPTGWATLRGVIKVNGAPPPREPLSNAVSHDDAAVCAPNGRAPLAEEVVVGPDGGLSGVAIYVGTPIPLDNPKWLHESYASQRGTEVIFDQKNCIFLTHVAAMWTEQTLKILNSDPVGHNTKIDTKGGARPFNQTIGVQGSTTYEPGGEERAPAPVSCSIHTWMKAYLLPRDNPYFDVTDDTGEFVIENVPAGVELEFRVWQPRLEFADKVSVEMNGQPREISKGRLKLTLEPGESTLNAAWDAGIFQ